MSSLCSAFEKLMVSPGSSSLVAKLLFDDVGERPARQRDESLVGRICSLSHPQIEGQPEWGRPRARSQHPQRRGVQQFG